MKVSLSRKTFTKASSLLLAVALFSGNHTVLAQTNRPSAKEGHMQLTPKWDKTFPQNNKIEHRKATFKNRYGITLAADVYIPKNHGAERLPAIAVSDPFGAVKEQSSGLYARIMAERGFIT